MLEGFENALDSFIERQEHIDEVKAKIYGINGKRDSELDAIDHAIAAIRQRVSDRDNLHISKLPPEAFKGYGGQSPQYEDNWNYGCTEEENKELEQLFEKRKNLLKELSNAEV